jgi:hypothetical protein
MPFNSLQKPDKTFAHFNSLPNHNGNRNMTSSPPSGQKLSNPICSDLVIVFLRIELNASR